MHNSINTYKYNLDFTFFEINTRASIWGGGGLFSAARLIKLLNFSIVFEISLFFKFIFSISNY